MSRSTSPSKDTSHADRPHARGAHGGGGSHGPDDGGGGGGGGGGGRLVKVAFARNQAEAELLQGLLAESGIPSVLKRSRGFDAPEFLAAGPHDVFVDSAMAKRAKELLAETLIESEAEERAEVAGQARREGESDAGYPYRLALWVAAAALGAVILVWVLYQLS
jgi:Putative prokaryotic signal transducing protein